MKFLSNRALERLRAGAELPDLSGTRYRLLDRIARGGMGAVYLAEDDSLKKRQLDCRTSKGRPANGPPFVFVTRVK